MGRGRLEAAGPKPAEPLTLMVGAAGAATGVTEIEGALTLGARLEAGDSLIAMLGISGVTAIEGTSAFMCLLGAGVSLTEMVGMGGVTPIDGTFALDPRRGGPLTEMDGVSDTEMDGTGWQGDVLERREEDW